MKTQEELLSLLLREIQKKQAASDHILEEGAHACKVDGCSRKTIAKDLCNPHYIRYRKGFDFNIPIKRRKKNALCSECQEPIGNKGGWGLCDRHYKRERYVLIKELLVESLGGCCSKCGISYPLAVYDFHHILTGTKEADPGSIIRDGSLERITEEISKCVLLCANCHRLEHHGD